MKFISSVQPGSRFLRTFAYVALISALAACGESGQPAAPAGAPTLIFFTIDDSAYAEDGKIVALRDGRIGPDTFVNAYILDRSRSAEDPTYIPLETYADVLRNAYLIEVRLAGLHRGVLLISDPGRALRGETLVVAVLA